jgi:hypothetical protein
MTDLSGDAMYFPIGQLNSVSIYEITTNLYSIFPSDTWINTIKAYDKWDNCPKVTYFNLIGKASHVDINIERV